MSTGGALPAGAANRLPELVPGSVGSRSSRLAWIALLVVGLALVLYTAFQVVLAPTPHAAAPAFPRSASMERATGVQFSRVAVVGDGGLILVEYVVQDVEKATAFQGDREHVPTISSQERSGGTNRVSIMKPGHLIRAGQTYYFVYQNTGGVLRPGDLATIRYLDHQLTDVPVE